MPMYDYSCKNCGEKFEELIFSSSMPDEEITCPKCNKNDAERLLTAPMVSTKNSSVQARSSSSPGCGHSGFS